MAEPWPHVSTSNRACCSAATCSTCFLTHGGRRPGLPERTRQTALCRENPGAFDVTERGHTTQNHAEEVDGVTRSYQGRRQAQRGQPLAPTADRARHPEPRVHSDSLAHPPGPRNKNHPAGEAGPRTRTRPPREARSAASIRRLPGEASVLHGPAPGSRRGRKRPAPARGPSAGTSPASVVQRLPSACRLPGTTRAPGRPGTTPLLERGQGGACQRERRDSQRQRQDGVTAHTDPVRPRPLLTARWQAALSFTPARGIQTAPRRSRLPLEAPRAGAMVPLYTGGDGEPA